MFGQKQKKNKFNLPVAEEPKFKTKLGKPVGDQNLIPDLAEAVEPSPVEPPDENAQATENQDATNPYHLVVIPDRPADEPHKNWEVYYRNRSYAGSVGDPLLTVVEADSQAEAELKASHLQQGDDSGVIAVNTNNPVIHGTKESQFVFPKSTYDKLGRRKPQ